MKRLALSLFLLLASVVASNAANRFLTCATACTITASDTSIWGTTSGGTGASVPGSSDAVILDAATCVGGTTCTATMGSGYNPTWSSLTMGACTASTTGCILDFSVNNNSITLGLNGTGFSGSGSGTRTLRMGGGVWTLSGAGAIWDITTKTNLTLTPGSSTIVFSNVSTTSARQFISASLTYNAVTVGSNTSSGLFTFALAGATVTIPTVTLTAPNRVRVSNAATLAVTTLTATGSQTQLIQMMSDATGSTATISSASNQTFNWIDTFDLIYTGGGTFVANNSFSQGNNTGISISAPSPAGSNSCILGGWLLYRDLDPAANDNFPAFLEKAG